MLALPTLTALAAHQSRLRHACWCAGFDLWNLDAEGKAVQPPEEDRAARGGEWDVGSTDWEQ
eukprot:630746-Rhodomonas_salina.2